MNSLANTLIPMKLYSRPGISDKKMDPEVYRVIPSSVSVSALQSRNKETLKVYENMYGYTFDDEHMIELTKPQLYYITALEPTYVNGLQVSSNAIKRVADAHPDIYILTEDGVYIDPVIYSMYHITSYAQELMKIAHTLQKSMSNGDQ